MKLDHPPHTHTHTQTHIHTQLTQEKRKNKKTKQFGYRPKHFGPNLLILAWIGDELCYGEYKLKIE